MATVLAVAAYTFLILKHDPALVNLEERLWPASMEHPLGTDHLGRDVLTRL
ncbi:nickel ABC transporter permease subunit NikC, partial [Peribacillus frigoritolerans]|nr:nickel ABC transporter permease subunit NikC [Peribacillus frigoritolerans]